MKLKIKFEKKELLFQGISRNTCWGTDDMNEPECAPLFTIHFTVYITFKFTQNGTLFAFKLVTLGLPSTWRKYLKFVFWQAHVHTFSKILPEDKLVKLSPTTTLSLGRICTLGLFLTVDFIRHPIAFCGFYHGWSFKWLQVLIVHRYPTLHT